MEATGSTPTDARRKYQDAVERAALGDEKAQGSLPGLWRDILSAEEHERHALAIARAKQQLADVEALERAERVRAQGVANALDALDRRAELAVRLEEVIGAFADLWREFERATVDASAGRRFLAAGAAASLWIGRTEFEVLLGCLARRLGRTEDPDIAFHSTHSPADGWAAWIAQRDRNNRRVLESASVTSKEAV